MIRQTKPKAFQIYEMDPLCQEHMLMFIKKSIFDRSGMRLSEM